jgi:carbon monoxide dehydrogenase subunit G
MAIELDNSFTVPVPPAQAWEVLLDVERIGPCMPGAVVDSVDGDEITGRVTVKLGPVKLTYKGTATFTERDEDKHSIAMEASGKETRGSGTASAVVKAGLTEGETEDSTLVTIHTSLNVTGKPAQFGRGVMADVSAKLIDQFAANLAALLTDGAGPAAAEAETAAAENAAPVTTEATPAPVQQQESLNIVRLAAKPVLKRVIPVAAAAGALALLYRRVRGMLRRAK